MSMRTDVVIAGGGIVGTLLGIALARAGLGAAIVDPVPAGARQAGDFDGRAYAIAASGRRMLEALGIWAAIAAEAQPMTDILVSDGRPGEAPSPRMLHFDHREGDGGPFAWMIEDRVLRAALIEAAAATPGLVHLAPAAVVAETPGPGGIVVALADGRTVGAAMLAACDGRASAVARRAGLTRLGWDYPQSGLVCALEVSRPHEGVAHELFLPGGPFAILPLTGQRVSLVWTERRGLAEAIDALPDAAYLAEIRHRMGDFLGPVRLTGRRWTYPLSLSLAQSWVAPRTALLGDAAHVIHPLAGQGLNLGMRDVAAMAEVLAEARRRGEDPGAPDVLRRYQSWRRFDATAMALACEGMNRLFSTDAPGLRGIRDAGLGMVARLPWARRAFMRMAAGEAGEMPRLMRGEPV